MYLKDLHANFLTVEREMDSKARAFFEIMKFVDI